MSWLDLSNVSNILRQSYINGFLDVSGLFITRNNAQLQQSMSVSGDAFLTRLFVLGDTSMVSNVFVTGNLRTTTPGLAENSTKVATTEFVKGILSGLTAGASFTGAVVISETLSVGQDVSFTANLYTARQTTIGGDLIGQSRLFISNDVSFGSTLFVQGDASLNNRLLVGSDIWVNKRLNVIGDASLNSRLLVGSDASFGQKVFVQGDVSVNSRLSVGSDVSLTGNLSITRNIQMAGVVFQF